MKQRTPPYKCDCCGKFIKEEDVVLMWGEDQEQWLECKFCCSQADLDRYFLKQ